MRSSPRKVLVTVLVLAVLGSGGCGTGDSEEGTPVEVRVPPGATFRTVTDTLVARGLVDHPLAFRIYARLRGEDDRVRAGRYALRPGSGWGSILDALVQGRVVTEEMTVPEGFTLARMAPRLARVTELEPDSVLHYLETDSLDGTYDVPGPGLEGYLFPDTYRFAAGVPLPKVVGTMVERYREALDAEDRARAEELGLTEREVVTLASIIQAEARLEEEMPRISAVYHNRLELGYPLQADPTVLYALGGRRERLLFAAIDSVADHPYNTYTHPGLPPGPIGSPGEAALDAALNPADVPHLYFVARPDGSHIFTRSLQEHNRARIRARREWERSREADSAGAEDRRGQESGT